MSESATENPKIQRSPTTKRVLHLVNGEHYAGSERVQDLLALKLPEFGYEVTFVCLKPILFPKMRMAQQVACLEEPMRYRFDLRPVRKIAELVRKQQIELIHTHTPRSILIGRLVARQLGLPLVHHVHSPTTNDSIHWVRDRINATIERRCMLKAQAAVAVSASLGRYAQQQGLSSEKVFVVPNGVAIQGELAPRETPQGVWTLGMVALFRPRKGLEVLLDALAQLRQQGLEFHFRAVGPFETSEYQQQIQQQVARLKLEDVITWVGFTKQVQAELRQFDLMALPSLFGEGLPMVLLEAMAAGVPVVGTQVEGVPEALRHGIEGVIVPPGDASAFAAGIQSITQGNLNWQNLREAAHQRQADLYSDRSMAQGVAKVYDQFLAR